MSAVADLGGSILTGIDGNPLAVLARQLRIPLHAINSEGVPLYCSNGKEANRRLDQQARCFPAPCHHLQMRSSIWRSCRPATAAHGGTFPALPGFQLQAVWLTDSSLESPQGILLKSHTKVLPQLQTLTKHIVSPPCTRECCVADSLCRGCRLSTYAADAML